MSSSTARVISNQEVLVQFLAEIENVVGAANLILSPKEIEARSRDIIPIVRIPSGYVYPGSVEEVQAITRLANEYGVPLWPCGKGKNWGYGAATPAQDGGLVMVLERLNRILKVDSELAYVVIEPGVTYRQLHRYLVENNIDLWLDCTDGPADGSVMGNALERGIGETNLGDHFGNICGMEVILPDGSLVETGGGPIGYHKSLNTYKWGVGPYLEGLFSQANFGIVTKIGMWLMPKPEYFASCLFELREEADLPKLMDAMRRLQLNGAIQSKVHIINDVVTFSIIANNPKELLNGAPTLSEERKAELRREFNIAPWTFAAGLYGSHAQIRAAKALIKRELKSLGRLDFIDDFKISVVRGLVKFATGIRAETPWRKLIERAVRIVFKKPLSLLQFLPYVHDIEKGYPSDFFVKHAYYKSRSAKPDDSNIDPARDNCGLIWLGPMVPLDGKSMTEVLGIVRPLYAKYGFDFTTALMVGNARTVIALMSIFYDKLDEDETRRAKELYYEMGRLTQEAGYQQYRTGTIFMDQILKPAPEVQALCQRIKQALDPNGILAPGKYGIK